MKRREFVAALGMAAAWPSLAMAQQAGRARVVAILVNFPEGDPEGQARINRFLQALHGLGWTEGLNLRTEIRWPADDASLYRRYAQELVAARPDVFLACGSPSAAALQQATKTIPIVFANVVDPVGAAFVSSMSHPGGNITGFTAFEYTISGKWLEILRELSPGLKRVAVVREPTNASGIGQFAAIQAFASSSGLELTAIDPRDGQAIKPALAALAIEPDGGVIVTASSSSVANRELLIETTLRHRLPAVFPFPFYAAAGGLAAYGPDTVDVHARAATYVDRILRGEKPADLPVQAPTKYYLVVNSRMAKALGLTLPPSLLARADEVIE